MVLILVNFLTFVIYIIELFFLNVKYYLINFVIHILNDDADAIADEEPYETPDPEFVAIAGEEL